MHTDPIREKLKIILASEFGITNEDEINRRIDDMLEPKRDLTKYADKAQKVHPTASGFKTADEMRQLKEDIKKKYG